MKNKGIFKTFFWSIVIGFPNQACPIQDRSTTFRIQCQYAKLFFFFFFKLGLQGHTDCSDWHTGKIKHFPLWLFPPWLPWWSYLLHDWISILTLQESMTVYQSQWLLALETKCVIPRWESPSNDSALLLYEALVTKWAADRPWTWPSWNFQCGGEVCIVQIKAQVNTGSQTG